MLEKITVENYALIDSLDLEFDGNFSVITGETGSGKSILLGALELALGKKGDKSAIREGKDESTVTLLFSSLPKRVLKYLDEHGFSTSGDDSLVIRRKIKENGRGSGYINGSVASLKELEEIGSLLIDISSQHSYQKLLDEKNELMMLDSTGKCKELRDEVFECYHTYKGKKSELEDLIEKREKGREERDYNEYLLSELERANLREGEDEELEEKLKVISSSEYIVENLSGAKEAISGASGYIESASGYLKKAERKYPDASEFISRIESISIDLEDVNESIKERLGEFEFDEREVEEMNERLSQLQRIRKKYGGSIEKAMGKRDELKLILGEEESFEEKVGELEREVSKAREKLSKVSEELTKKRVERAKVLSKKTTGYLKRLGMADAEFKVEIEEKEFSPDGKDKISFLLKANHGEKMLPLSKAASGGELSRIMLSIKASFIDSEDVDTMIFDEVDSGVGGKTASDVGSLLSEIAGKRQVFAITHLAQIASRGTSHFLVEKKKEKERTVTRIRKRKGEERVEEIARLLSGEKSELALSHAKSLLEVQLGV